MPSNLNITNNDLYDLQVTGSAYRAADITRTNKDWIPAHRSGDGALDESWDLMTSRVRDLARNDPVVKKMQREVCKGVIGASGIQTFSEAREFGGESYDAFNEEADDFYEKYFEGDIDFEGRLSGSRMQWMILQEVLETGECFLLECWDDNPDRMLPICYQVLESEQLDRTVDWAQDSKKGGNYCRRGIEYDEKNRPVAYWFFDTNPHDVILDKYESRRVDADKVMHIYLPSRPSARGGASWFSANMQTSKDIDWYLGNELTAAALGAMLTAYIKRERRGGGSAPGFTDEDGDEHPQIKLGRGTITELGIDEEVGTIESNRPNRDAAPFIKLLLTMQGMGIGLSLLRVTGDYSQASYTSARGAHLDDQAYFAVLQNWLSTKFVAKIRRDVIAKAVASNKIKSVTSVEYLNNRTKYERLAIQPPGREQLDPDSESEGAERRMRNGTSNLQIECGLRGLNWRRVIDQKAVEQKYADKKGVQLDYGHTAAFYGKDEEREPSSPRTKKLEKRQQRLGV